MPSSLPQSDCTLACVSHAHTQVPQYQPVLYLPMHQPQAVMQYVQPAPKMQTVFIQRPWPQKERNSCAHHCRSHQKTPWQPQIEYQRKQPNYIPPVILHQPQIRNVNQSVQAPVQPQMVLQPVPETVYASAGSVAPGFGGSVPPMMFPPMMFPQVIRTKLSGAILLVPTLPLRSAPLRILLCVKLL